MAKIIQVDGSEKELDQVDLRSLQAAVGGYIEEVSIPGSSKVMIVNEEGRLKHLPLNPAASATAMQLIVGDAVICKRSELK